MSTTKTVLERIALALEALVADQAEASARAIKGEADVAARFRMSEENRKAQHLESQGKITEFQAAYTRQMQALMDEQAINEATRKREQNQLLEIMADQERRLQAFIGVEPRQPAVLYDITDGKPNKDKD